MSAPPKGIGDRPFDFKSPVVEGPTKVVVDWMERELKPVVRGMWRKLVGMFGKPAEFASVMWDGTTWHSVRFGSLATDLADADATLTVADGNIHVARKSSLTAPRTLTLSGFGAADYTAKMFLNFSLQPLTVVGATTMVVPAGSYGIARYTASGWDPLVTLPMVGDPVF